MKKIIERRDAIELGMKTYFTGRQCKNGHTDSRSTRNRTCLMCINDAKKRMASKSKDAAIEARRTKRVTLRSEALALGLNRYFTGVACRHGHVEERRSSDGKCMDCVRGKNRKRRAENPAYFAEALKRFHELNPNAKRAHENNRRARKTEAGGSHSASEINALLEKQKHKCAYCCKSVRKKQFHADHITPIARGGVSDIENIQILCPRCNLSKGAKDPIRHLNENLGKLI